ncbi:uncharacterized protein DS421_12g359300 [Arachis hypogaea]|nr:uncharacterized protein DS421_12g359300 [Arachis hypogaea]
MTDEGTTTCEEATNCEAAMTDELATTEDATMAKMTDSLLAVAVCVTVTGDLTARWRLAVVMVRPCRSAAVHVSERTGARREV